MATKLGEIQATMTSNINKDQEARVLWRRFTDVQRGFLLNGRRSGIERKIKIICRKI